MATSTSIRVSARVLGFTYAIRNIVAEAQTLALDYTPTFYVNGKVVTNPQGYEAFKALIDAAAK